MNDQTAAPIGRRIADGLINLVTSLGATGSKGAQTTYTPTLYAQIELDTAYRESWFRKIVDIPPFDAIRQWRDWQAEKEDIAKIEEEETRLGLRLKLMDAMTWGRLYGGGALVLGIKGQKSDQPLDPESIGPGALEYIHATHRWRLKTEELETDPLSPFYGSPKSYSFQLQQGGQVNVHPSRVVRFLGNRVPDFSATNEVWSDSLWHACRAAVMNADTAATMITGLLQEAKVDVVKVPGLMEGLATVEFAERLKQRFGLAMTLKSTNNTILIDGEEEWEQKTLNFAGLPEVLKLLLMVLAGAADIPATRLLGKSPDGMNATGESDLTNYYDMVKSRQEVELTPAMLILDKALVRSAGVEGRLSAVRTIPRKAQAKPLALKSALRNAAPDNPPEADPPPKPDEPDEVYYEWAPLWQMTPAARSEVDKRNAETAQIYVTIGAMPDTVSAKVIQNKLIEDNFFPGLEGALEEAEAAGELASLEEPPPTPEELATEALAGQGFAPGVKPPAAAGGNVVPFKRAAGDRGLILDGAQVRNLQRMVKDATPRSLYVYRKVLNGSEIARWAKEQGFTTTVPPTDMHVTIAHSKTAVDWMKVGSPWNDDKDGKMTVGPGGARLVDKLGDGATVLLFNSTELAWRHESIKHAGAVWDFPEYQPHITITYQSPLSEADFQKVVPYRGKIELGPEWFEEINEDGVDDLQEV